MLSKEKATRLAEKIREIYEAEFNEDDSPDGQIVVHIHNSQADAVPGGRFPVEVNISQLSQNEQARVSATVGGFPGNRE